tara:strand:- start:1239 stop:1457 length:219 start_codon:yes stop_codon:yes gene_type:complete
MTKNDQIEHLTNKLAQASIKIKNLYEINKFHQDLNGQLRKELKDFETYVSEHEGEKHNRILYSPYKKQHPKK